MALEEEEMEEEGGNPSVVLVEQHEALRDGLAVLLERRGFESSAARRPRRRARR
jgi:DNA-binding response OmpR family regulator